MDDTIAAVSTAPGRAGLAVVRASGPGVAEIAAAVGLPDLEARRATAGRLRHPEDGRPLDRVVATRFAAPASYTGEDVLEIACHGGSLVPGLVLDALLAAGARPAGPGEFSRRAFLNGKLDLIQLEATVDVVDARSEALHRSALFQLEGGLSRRIGELREGLVRLRAMLSYAIDFPEEDDGPIPQERLGEAAGRLRDGIRELLRHAPEGELLREGALTVVAGRPNVGKSSLFNALLGEERAIVTDVPGTTRDAIEALASIGSYPFRLVDTAGLRDRPGPVEGFGIEVARRYLSRADLVLVCVEAGRPPGDDEREFVERISAGDPRVIVVETKADLAPDGGDGCGGWSGAPRPIRVSAAAGTGLPALRDALVAAVYAGIRGAVEAPLVTRRRQARALRAAAGHLEAFADARRRGLPAELLATHVADAGHALETLVGGVDPEEVLDALFSSFCVGK